MDLRAYLVPPFRAEEWYRHSGFVQGTGVLGLFSFPIPINGNVRVPDGYRGVVAHARLTFFEVFPLDASAAIPDWASPTEGLTWSIYRNGVAVPGFFRRPCVFSYLQQLSNDLGSARYGVQPPGEYDILVPVKLRSGDALSVDINFGVGTVARAFYIAFWLQGWIFPASCEDESAAGSAADPWPG